MASRCFLVLLAVALVHSAMARQDPSDKEASQIEPQGLIRKPVPGRPPFPRCIPRKQPIGSEGEDVYQATGLKFCPPPPPPATPPPTTPPSPPTPPPTTPPQEPTPPPATPPPATPPPTTPPQEPTPPPSPTRAPTPAPSP